MNNDDFLTEDELSKENLVSQEDEKKGKFLMACYIPGTPASQLEATIEELQKKNAELSEELEKKTVELQLLRKRPSDWAYEKTFLQTKVDIYERVLKAQGLITD